MDVRGIDWEFGFPEFPYTVYEEGDDITPFLESFGNGVRYGFDVETTGLSYATDRIAGLSLATENNAWYFHGDWAVRKILPWLEAKMHDGKTLFIAHNFKFDAHFLAHFNIRPKRIYDTMIAQYLLAEEDVLKLKELARIYLGVTENIPDFSDLQKLGKQLTGKRRMDEVSIYDIPIEVLGVYGALDSRLAFDFAPITEHGLRAEGLWDYYLEEEVPFIYVLMDMEKNGARIDKHRAQELKDEFQSDLDKYYEEWEKKVGDVNPRSPLQLRELLYEKLKLGATRLTKKTKKPSTDHLALQRLSFKDKTGTVELLLKIREHEKLINTYLIPFLTRTHNERIYTDFNRTGTVTGRLSSSGDINLQNIPIHSDLGAKVRSCFIPDEGHKLIGADYSQVELRLLTHFCRDKTLVRAYLWGVDIHQLTADRIGVPRFTGKTLNFLTIYGGGPNAFGDSIEKLGKPRPSTREASRLIAEYNRLYPAIERFRRQVINEAKMYGYITTIIGRHRHANLDLLDTPNEYVRSREERKLFNTKIQGSAGDVINYAMKDLAFNFLPEYGAKMLLQVHDELLFSVPEETADSFLPIAKAQMENVREVFNISIPIIAEPKMADTWVEAK